MIQTLFLLFLSLCTFTSESDTEPDDCNSFNPSDYLAGLGRFVRTSGGIYKTTLSFHEPRDTVSKLFLENFPHFDRIHRNSKYFYLGDFSERYAAILKITILPGGDINISVDNSNYDDAEGIAIFVINAFEK